MSTIAWGEPVRETFETNLQLMDFSPHCPFSSINPLDQLFLFSETECISLDSVTQLNQLE